MRLLCGFDDIGGISRALPAQLNFNVMSTYEFGGPQDIEKALDMLVNLDQIQTNAIVEIEIDTEIERLQAELDKIAADPNHVPDKDFVEVLGGYVQRADDWNSAKD